MVAKGNHTIRSIEDAKTYLRKFYKDEDFRDLNLPFSTRNHSETTLHINLFGLAKQLEEYRSLKQEAIKIYPSPNPKFINESLKIHETINSLKIEGVDTSYKEVKTIQKKLENMENNDISPEELNKLSHQKRDVLANFKAFNYIEKNLHSGKLTIGFISSLYEIFFTSTTNLNPYYEEMLHDPVSLVRKEEVWIAGRNTVKPADIGKYMSHFVSFFNAADGLPVELKSQIIHLYFELIHPFQDFNGRIGRLLSMMYLAKSKVLYPVYISAATRMFQADYYNSFQQTHDLFYLDTTPFCSTMLEILKKQLIVYINLRKIMNNNIVLYKELSRLDKDVITLFLSRGTNNPTPVKIENLLELYSAYGRTTIYDCIRRLIKQKILINIGDKKSLILVLSEKAISCIN